MKALVYTGPGELDFRDEADPSPEPGESLLRVEACCICGSDMHAFHGKDERRKPPLILGHEAVGTVIEGRLAGRRVVISAGPTREPIDPVRYLTNRSSGKMGYALAQAALRAGADVTLVSGPVALEPPKGAHLMSVETALQMEAAVTAAVDGADIFVSAAAVSDYRPAAPKTEKMKKQAETLSLDLTRSPDILAQVAASDARPFCVGFAAETNDVREHALGKMRDKKLDMIVANRVGENLAFDQDDNAVTVYWSDGEQSFPREAKTTLAVGIIDCVAQRFASTQ